MKITIYMIRHGATRGNLEKRYVGSTDEELLPESVEALKNMRRKIPPVEKVYISPMTRCRQTAEYLYPGVPLQVIEAFRECDFGEFEYCNYTELNGHPAYQKFIDTMGRSGFPGGEDRSQFQHRCVDGFKKLVSQWQQNGRESAVLQDAQNSRNDIFAALVVHGGTIMALLDAFSNPHRDYYDWQTGNGKGYAMELVSDVSSGQIVLENIRPM